MSDLTTTAPPADPPAEEAFDVYELFEANLEAEREGVKLEIGKSWFRIRSIDNVAVKRVRTKQVFSQMKTVQANRGIIPEVLMEQNNIELACAVCTDWGDLPHPDPEKRKAGVPFPYSAVNAKALFSEARLRNLRDWVLGQAQNFENFRAQAAADAEGNSAPASNGSSSTAPTSAS